MALPIMIFALYTLMFPMKMMEEERKTANRLEMTAKKLCTAEYVRQTGMDKIDIEKDKKELVDSVLNGVSQGITAFSMITAADSRYFDNVYISPESKILSDGDGDDETMVYAKLCYTPAIPFFMFDVDMPEKSIVTNRRAWVGSKGGRGRSKYGDELTEEDGNCNDKEKTVYLGKTSSEVYHLDPHCHYLSNNLSSTDAGNIGELRNKNGSKYHPCSSCKPTGSGMVYYSESGTKYHKSEDCKAITAYSKSVKLSEAEGMRPCSYCGRTGEH